ncbi:RHS repeat-associated core domain-containing protein [Pseudomonas sp. SDO55104_S430]
MSRSKQSWLIHYRYDPLDKVAGHSTPDASELQRFYSKNQLATEVEGAVRHSIVQHENLLLAQQRHESDVLDTTLLATDFQRSVLHTLEPNQQQSIAYSPYGHRSVESGLSSLLGFNGERPDQMTGHYLLGNGYRAFNPVLIRFNSPDRLSPFGKGGLNCYAYCKGDPVNFTDPTGTSIFTWLGQQLGLTPTYFGDASWTKPGVSASKGRKVYERIQAIDKKMQATVDNGPLQTYGSDKALVAAAVESPDRSATLQMLSYQKTRRESVIFQPSIDTATEFGLPYSRVIERAARSEQASYQPLFDFIDSNRLYAKDFINELHRIAPQTPDAYKVHMSTYIRRLETWVDREFYGLAKERKRIHDKYFYLSLRI